MINRFEKQLEKWNNGILRGAQAKLAKTLGVTTATVALWATAQRHPSKGYIAKMARLFGMSEYEALRLFTSPSPTVSLLRETPYRNEQISAHTNECTLPFFTHLPPRFPDYAPQDIAGWWTLPKSTADGATFILECSVGEKTEIWFIKPALSWQDGQLMLARKGQNWLAGQVFLHQRTSVSPFTRQNGDQRLQSLTPVGIVVRRFIQSN